MTGMDDRERPAEVWIEQARLDDVPDLARLRWQLYAEQEGSREPLETYQDRFVAFALRALATDRWHAWVARDGAGPIGAMWLKPTA